MQTHKADLATLQAENDWLRKQLGVAPYPCPRCKELQDKLDDLEQAYNDLQAECDIYIKRLKSE